jgi:transcriptional regulator with XRE-family HTH domain
MITSRKCLSLFLELFRQQNSWTKKELAAKLDIEIPYLGRLRRCEINFTSNYFDGILSKLNVTHLEYYAFILAHQTEIPK